MVMEDLYTCRTLFSIFALLFLMLHVTLSSSVQDASSWHGLYGFYKSRRYSGPFDCAIKTIKTERFWSAVLPLDGAKTIIEIDPDKSTSRNPFHILGSIYRRAGLEGCYAGLGPTMVRAFPAKAAAIVTWEPAIKVSDD